jgi:hypothetical protein
MGLEELAVGAPVETHHAGLIRWCNVKGDFTGWKMKGTRLTPDGHLKLDPATAMTETDPYVPGTYFEGNYYNGGAYQVGEACSPVTTASFTFQEAVASWNAETPPGAWVEVQVRVRFGACWSEWYVMGIWASGTETVRRHSVRSQTNEHGSVAVDTLSLSAGQDGPTVFQLKLRLFSIDAEATPAFSAVSLAYSTAPVRATVQAGNPALWNTLLDVPQCSQMIYPDGGRVWCSPTSIAMVLAYWGQAGPCEPRLRAAVAGVYDWIYDGHGNWPFNTAYAAAQGIQAFVARFTSLAQAETWLAAGVPLLMSVSWGKDELEGAPIPGSAGHLVVLVGFDGSGAPIFNDPAAASNEEVRRTYRRKQFERLWLEHTGGTVYLIYPPGWKVPAIEEK